MNWPEKIDIKMAMKTHMPCAKISPHSQAWSVPDSVDLNDPPLGLEDGQIEAIIIAAWRELMLHDEVLSAISILEKAPFRIRHSKVIEEALKYTKSTIEWMEDKETQRVGNSPLDPNGVPLSAEITDPLPNKLNSHVGARYGWITNRLDGNKILDLGCIDGTMTNRWGLLGYEVTGVDLSTTSIKIAKEKAKEFETNAIYVNDYFANIEECLQNNHYDNITCSDVYEHLKDPVKELLIPAMKMCRAGGKMLLVTPNGSWMRGQVMNWAAPWTWVEEGLSWIWGKPRGHIVAPSIWTVAKHFEESGWWIKNVVVMNQPKADVSGQSNVCVEAIKGMPPTWPGKSILVVDPESPTEKGMKIAKEFAALGNKVEYVSKNQTEGYEDHVMLTNYLRLNKKNIDVVITDNIAILEIAHEWNRKISVIELESISNKNIWEILQDNHGLKP